ncbi:sugar phosphate isomerase/epimerase family protein [Halomicrobium urmianum]|uniref:sugar phosphate isomerase/epimerase family protein n=1 Tax=Halomicrobium urmianum TaxID=1586233 RepID=UPI001CD99442|nr:TIM barrel protein [Halomicrobium urmianum]
MEHNRRDVLKAGGAFAIGTGAIGQAAAQEDGSDSQQGTETEGGGDQSADLLANCWMHSGGTTPFKGAHGHREWSPWSLERRAEGLGEVGFNAIGLYHEDIRYRVEHEFTDGNLRARLQQMNNVLQQNGIDFVEVEFLTEWPLGEDDYRYQNNEENRQLLLEAADVLGANHVKVGNINGYPVSMEQLQQRFADISRQFSEVDTQVGMEFFPVDPNVRDISQAMEATRIAREEGTGGLYLDLWHLVKLGVDFDNIRALSADDITAVEFQDGYIETEMSFLEETINLRKVPGEGEFPISDWVNAVREAGFEGPWGLEILSEEFRRLSMDVAYPLAYNAGAEYVSSGN